MVSRDEREADPLQAADAPSDRTQLELIDLRLTLWADELGRGRMPNERVMGGIDALLDSGWPRWGAVTLLSTMSARLPMED